MIEEADGMDELGAERVAAARRGVVVKMLSGSGCDGEHKRADTIIKEEAR